MGKVAPIRKVPPTWYTLIWCNKWLTARAKTIGDMIATLRQSADALEEMSKAGITLIDDSGTEDDYARLLTTDPVVAKKFGLQEEEEGKS